MEQLSNYRNQSTTRYRFRIYPKFLYDYSSFPLLINCGIHPEEGEDKEGKNKLPTILKVPDELWDKIKNILPKEKPLRTVGRPIIPYRKVIDRILYVLRTDVSGRCYLKNMDQVLPVIVDFRSGTALIYSKRHG